MQSKASGRELGLHSALSLAGCTCTCPDRIEPSHWSRRRLPRPMRDEKTVLQQWGAGPVRRSFSCPPGWLSQNSRLLNITLARDPNITTPAPPTTPQVYPPDSTIKGILPVLPNAINILIVAIKHVNTTFSSPV